MSKREEIAPHGDRRSVRDNAIGRIQPSVEEGAALSANARRTTNASPAPGRVLEATEPPRGPSVMSGEPDDLDRFVQAQAGIFDRAVDELRTGRKRTHWMWFVFPQLKGLGHSPTAQRYGISDREEALAYLQHPILGPRLELAVSAAMSSPAASLTALMGSPDDLKFRSSMTLFATVAPQGPYQAALDRWCEGSRDPRTVGLLKRSQRAIEGDPQT